MTPKWRKEIKFGVVLPHQRLRMVRRKAKALTKLRPAGLESSAESVWCVPCRNWVKVQRNHPQTIITINTFWRYLARVPYRTLVWGCFAARRGVVGMGGPGRLLWHGWLLLRQYATAISVERFNHLRSEISIFGAHCQRKPNCLAGLQEVLANCIRHDSV